MAGLIAQDAMEEEKQEKPINIVSMLNNIGVLKLIKIDWLLSINLYHKTSV